MKIKTATFWKLVLFLIQCCSFITRLYVQSCREEVTHHFSCWALNITLHSGCRRAVGRECIKNLNELKALDQSSRTFCVEPFQSPAQPWQKTHNCFKITPRHANRAVKRQGLCPKSGLETAELIRVRSVRTQTSPSHKIGAKTGPLYCQVKTSLSERAQEHRELRRNLDPPMNLSSLLSVFVKVKQNSQVKCMKSTRTNYVTERLIFGGFFAAHLKELYEERESCWAQEDLAVCLLGYGKKMDCQEVFSFL